MAAMHSTYPLRVRSPHSRSRAINCDVEIVFDIIRDRNPGLIDYSNLRAASKSRSISASLLNRAGDTRTVPLRAVTLILFAKKSALTESIGLLV